MSKATYYITSYDGFGKTVTFTFGGVPAFNTFRNKINPSTSIDTVEPRNWAPEFKNSISHER